MGKKLFSEKDILHFTQILIKTANINTKYLKHMKKIILLQVKIIMII